MPMLYISYRNADHSASFTALNDALDARFGTANVIRDAAAFDRNNYIAGLESAIMSADRVLVVVGPNWLTVTNDAGQRRIDQPNDVVHYEIGRALALLKPITVVRIDAAAPLTETALPDDLHALTQQPTITFATSADLDQLLPSWMPVNVAPDSNNPPSSLGLAITILASIATFFTLFPVGRLALAFAALPLLFIPHGIFLAAWVLGMFVAGRWQRWGWLAALGIPLVLFVLVTLWISIMVAQSDVPGAADLLLLPIFASYSVEGFIGILLIIFGLLVAGKLSFAGRITR